MADVITKPERRAPALKAPFFTNKDAKRDLQTLKSAAETGTECAPANKLTFDQLWEIERMAAQGMNLLQIGTRLHIPIPIWEGMCQANAQVAEAYQAGLARGVDLASGAIFHGFKNGDIGAAKYYLDRLGGPQFVPPKSQQPAVIVQTGSVVQIDTAAHDAALDRQRELIAESLDLEPEPEADSGS